MVALALWPSNLPIFESDGDSDHVSRFSAPELCPSSWQTIRLLHEQILEEQVVREEFLAPDILQEHIEDEGYRGNSHYASTKLLTIKEISTGLYMYCLCHDKMYALGGVACIDKSAPMYPKSTSSVRQAGKQRACSISKLSLQSMTSKITVTRSLRPARLTLHDQYAALRVPEEVRA